MQTNSKDYTQQPDKHKVRNYNSYSNRLMGFFALVPILPTQIVRAMCLSRVFFFPFYSSVFGIDVFVIRLVIIVIVYVVCVGFVVAADGFFLLLSFDFLCTRFRFLYIYSIKEMELFAQWSAKV